MSHFTNKDKRNFGYGRQLNYAGLQALRDSYGEGRFATVQAHGERWRLFAAWCSQQHGLNDARSLDQALLQDYARHLSQAVKQGELAISTAQNRLSTVNRTLEVLRGDQQVRVSPSAALGLNRCNLRMQAPQGQERSQLLPLKQTLREQGFARVAAIIHLAREGGLRLREAILADLPRLQREAELRGRINIADGTKGGRRGAAAPRWIHVSEGLRQALIQATSVSPKGSRNLLEPAERYVDFIQRQVRPARNLLRAHGIKGFHELRTAYACERYQQITGQPAPVNGGQLHRENRKLDYRARELIAQELGHNRIDVVAAYIGGRR
ncbi:integrase domain-containing protein [Pseudomonas sp. B392_1p]|uniref:integrase domain-containing protein n=1 Tax=Pseudomonas sp. B392_1p TaxID=3457507 RepID=UPI003FD1DD04